MGALPLILVPGLMCDHAVWDPLKPYMPAQNACRVVDHGDANSLVDMATHLLHLAPPKFLLAGHSMGARVALEVVRLAPERVGGVALLSTGYLPKASGLAGEEEVRKRHRLLQIANDEGVRVMARDWVQGMVHPERLIEHELIERILAMFDRKDAAIFSKQIHALIHRPDATEVLESLHVPTLILCGQQDTWSPPSQHQAMHALAPHSTFEVIDHAGHMAPMEKPHEVAAAMSRWIAQCV
jgi:pimeloyl-ACP methyl ester carboxylesterase